MWHTEAAFLLHGSNKFSITVGLTLKMEGEAWNLRRCPIERFGALDAGYIGMIFENSLALMRLYLPADDIQ